MLPHASVHTHTIEFAQAFGTYFPFFVCMTQELGTLGYKGI
jgi:hypothetical protein